MMQGSYKRFEKWRASKDLTQMVTKNPDIYRIILDRLDILYRLDRL